MQIIISSAVARSLESRATTEEELRTVVRRSFSPEVHCPGLDASQSCSIAIYGDGGTVFHDRTPPRFRVTAIYTTHDYGPLGEMSALTITGLGC